MVLEFSEKLPTRKGEPSTQKNFPGLYCQKDLCPSPCSAGGAITRKHSGDDKSRNEPQLNQDRLILVVSRMRFYETNPYKK